MKELLLFVSIYTLVLTQLAYAYVDPGTGAILLQFLFGGVAGLLIVIKLQYQNIKYYLSHNIVMKFF